jgi:predicted enzyme related to lactoylglutathione lyase
MGSPIVYFEIAGLDGAERRSFFEGVFGWQIGASRK